MSADPTVTLTVGASTDKLKPVKVAVDVEFYDGNGRRFDLTKHNAIVALNSLNHWTGASYVEVEINLVLLQWKLRIRMGIRFVGLGTPMQTGHR